MLSRGEALYFEKSIQLDFEKPPYNREMEYIYD